MMKVGEKSRSKGRTQAEKVGRLKYNHQLLKRALHDLEEVKLMQRTILAGLKGMFHFEKPMIQKIACADEVDILILDCLYEAGGCGMLPKDLAVRLTQFKVRRHQVSRRILRMNKRLETEIGETLVEKRGWHWALRGFGFESWGDFEHYCAGTDNQETDSQAHARHRARLCHTSSSFKCKLCSVDDYVVFHHFY